MKYHISNVIVVEGKDDEAYLSSFIDAVFVKTNGYEIPKEEVAFLNNPRIKKPIIVLSDSDDAGKEIRNRLKALIKNSVQVEVDVLKCNKKNKHGVAECDKDEIINALKEHIDNVNTVENITTADITNLLIDKNKRYYLCEKLQLGKCNNKAFIKRLNYLEFTLDELKQYGNK